jgi:hypothetical protein
MLKPRIGQEVVEERRSCIDELCIGECRSVVGDRGTVNRPGRETQKGHHSRDALW